MIAFESFGARIGVELPDGWTGAELLSRFPPRSNRIRSDDLDARYRVEAVEGDPRSGTGNERWRVTAGDELIDVASGRDRAAKVLAHELNFAVARHARDWIFVHAGVVAHRCELLLFPGPTGSGKSTLVRALVEEGATYYSDDLAPVDPNGRVHAFPRSLRLRGEEGFRELPDPDAGKDRPPARPSRIFFLEHQANEGGAVDWPPITPGGALLLLIQNSVQARTSPECSIEHLQPAVVAADTCVGTRGEARAAAARVLGDVTDVQPATEQPMVSAASGGGNSGDGPEFENAEKLSPAASATDVENS